ncbi:hypothetical protein D4764_20G0009590 [Takifugu flavidus]|uniref:Peptidase A2 domain-containing protein n=1 Tax=Takifugu flavidus TaxID=433684 RepID=A0A5C6NMP7_9TELE|nr:hypothetical protein D4764_20G0009590 [Takifugu flavidus]
MNVRIGAQSFSHTFLYGPDCPVNLLGRDIFTLLGCNIDIAQGGGTVITFRNGESFHCSDKAAHTQTLLWLGTENPGDLHTADIYWGLLTGPVDNPLMAAFRTWGPLIREFWACSPPPDPPHVTLFYDKDNDLTYQEWFNSSLDGQNWVVSVSGIVLGPQGVAAPVHLTPEQLQHYKMDKAAKEAAGLDLLGMYIMKTVETEQMEDLRPRTQAEWTEQQQWEEHGATVEEIGTEEEGQCSLWKGPKGQLVVPNRFLAQMCEEAHGPAHIPPEPQEKPDLIGEEYLLLKVLKRKWQEPNWTAPHRVTARTDTAVRFEGKGDTWYHLSQCAKVFRRASPPSRH